MAENHVLLETIELTQSAASVTFDNIPQAGYTDLKVVVAGRSNRGAHEDSVHIRLGNGTIDSGNNYGYAILYEYAGANLTSVKSTGQNSIVWQSPVTATSATGNTFGNSYFELPNYTSSTAKSVTCDSTTENNGADGLCGFTAGSWTGTSAVNIITLSPTTGTAFLAGSTFSLYGIAATGTTPTVAPLATGGNIVANDGTFWYHAFVTSGTFMPQTSLSCDVLVIAGGGGGGGANNGSIGGGGGAGGFQYLTSQALSLGTYAVTVGAGGAGGSGATPSSGTQGSNSVFGSLTASVGGGFGGGGSGIGFGFSGGNGGSGGGAGFSNSSATVGGTGTAGQGNNGGNEGSGGGGSGGGGAGGAGSPPSGGVGLANSITGTSITYAIGGQATGGAGNGVVPANPTANRGIGGDAGWNANGGNGGSGIVIIRYAM